jgi:predicted nucleic acid-binding protein
VRYYYFDSSALAKAYVLEAGSEQVRNILRSARAVPPTARALVSDLCSLEITSAILRKQSAGELTNSVAERLIARVESDFSPNPPATATPYQLISLAPGILQHGLELMTVYRLRTNDAIQLATALAARASTPLDVAFTFVGADDALGAAAAAEGMEVSDPAH